jgi:hypothetical protein
MQANTATRVKKAVLVIAMAALGLWLAWLLMRLVPALLVA